MNTTKIADLTVDELTVLIRNVVREALEEHDQAKLIDQRAILDIPPLSVGPWPEGLKLLSREEYYGDDER